MISNNIETMETALVGGCPQPSHLPTFHPLLFRGAAPFSINSPDLIDFHPAFQLIDYTSYACY